jgi:cytochrome c553
VRTYALLFVDPPEALPEGALRPAAGHYVTGCAICHGAPGEPRRPAVLAMLPPPPWLPDVLDTWTDAELFRIVEKGVRYSGMPAWPTQVRDEEVWMMVAFLRALPDLTPEEYARLAGSPRTAPGDLPPECARCHGPDGRGGGPHVPIIAGQSAAYLAASLAAYAEDHRPSGMMAQPASELTPEARAEIARLLAAKPSSLAPGAADGEGELGRRLAEEGRPEDKIPPCLECHGTPPRKPAFPLIAGQRPEVIATQLRLFRAGVRGGGPYSHLMHRVARGLSDADIAALAAYFGRAAPEQAAAR